MIAASEPLTLRAVPDPPLPGEPARRTLFESEASSLTLSFYPPMLRQAAHSHATPSIAMLLSGRIEEQAGARAAVVEAGSTGIKPDGLRHSNLYGPEGAILLTLTLRDPRLWAGTGANAWGWGRTGTEMQRLAAAALARRLPFADLVPELLARDAPPADLCRIPGWLAEIRSRLTEAPGSRLGDLAASAGVHRVHLSRSFRRCYGESVSAFRLRRKTEIALRGLLFEGVPAASAANDGGFADQSHFIRTTRRTLGSTPAQLQALRR
ncbi:MAG: AraC family transcriptional regulator [Sphingomonadales bacterium]|jgi:AraC family transcriptional regulator|nr:AraC family transcriptional regulator [Sphingomonadales bacterium]